MMIMGCSLVSLFCTTKFYKTSYASLRVLTSAFPYEILNKALPKILNEPYYYLLSRGWKVSNLFI